MFGSAPWSNKHWTNSVFSDNTAKNNAVYNQIRKVYKIFIQMTGSLLGSLTNFNVNCGNARTSVMSKDFINDIEKSVNQ